MPVSFAVVLPYFNEASYLPATLLSLVQQQLPPAQLILIDNGSTDGSEELARRTLAGQQNFDVIYLREPRPGKIHALERGQRYLRSEFVAFTDADTYYPPHYLAKAAQLFAERGSRCVAVMAKDIYCDPAAPTAIWTRWFYAALSRVLYWQTFAGGGGQTFRTAAFLEAGGYSIRHWHYTLEDHEIMNRLLKLGSACYHPDFWCQPSPRRCDRSKVGWNFREQMLYLVTPPQAGDWFFNRFLAARFEQRRIYQTNLREQSWRQEEQSKLRPGRAA